MKLETSEQERLALRKKLREVDPILLLDEQNLKDLNQQLVSKKKEVVGIEKEIKLAQDYLDDQENKAVVKHIDALISLVKHTRTSCKEDDPWYNEGRCNLCILKVAMREGYLPSEYRLVIQIVKR